MEPKKKMEWSFKCLDCGFVFTTDNEGDDCHECGSVRLETIAAVCLNGNHATVRGSR